MTQFEADRFFLTLLSGQKRDNQGLSAEVLARAERVLLPTTRNRLSAYPVTIRTRQAPCPVEGALQGFIRRKNIEHYRMLLAGPTLDEGTHKVVSKLLLDEEAKVSPLPKARDDD